MQGSIAVDGYVEFINSQWRPKGPSAKEALDHRQMDVVTISRQAGSGAHVVAGALVARLQPEPSEASCPWTIFDRNLVDKGNLVTSRWPADIPAFTEAMRLIRPA